MCGISGILQENILCSDTIQKINSILKHRGPDNNNIYIDDNIALGHNRLSIIDLSSDGNQPMQIEDTIIVFNGEIYNYVELKDELQSKGIIFKTKSDTEVLLQAYRLWGEDCLSKFNGMFAFAIWNNNTKILFCARDRLGIKPFYYKIDKDIFYFASEIKALLLKDNSPNYNVIKQYLVQGSYGLPHETFFKDIYALEPGTYMVVSKKGIEKRVKYWDICDNDKIYDEKYIQDEYFHLMLDSIKIHLRSDVPIGLNISSGLDSSILLGIINHYYKNQTKFHIYTYTCGDEQYDESKYVKELLEIQMGHICHQSITNECDFLNLFNKIQKQQDEPFGGLPTIAHSKIFEDAHNNNIKVLLCGEGMDEQWCGYDYYADVSDQNEIKNISVIQGTKNALIKDVLNPDFINGYNDIVYPLPFNNNMDNLKYRDIFYTKLPRSLRFVDHMSMASSTELRVPFLDYRLIELSFRMPLDLMIRNGEHKYLLRKIAKEMLPEFIINRRKRSLQTPQREWLRNENNIWIKDILNSVSFAQRGIFDVDKVNKMYNEYKMGCFDNSFFLWQWLNLEIWFRTFIDEK